MLAQLLPVVEQHGRLLSALERSSAKRRRVLDTPITPPFPEGFEQVVVGMGCFWGADRPF